MANDCPDKAHGSHPKVIPWLFIVEIQSNQDKITVQEKVEQIEHNNKEPTVENQEEIEGDENPVQDTNNEKQILYVKGDCELNNNNRPVAYLGVMHKNEESSKDEHIIQCAMMHNEPDLPELKEDPLQED